MDQQRTTPTRFRAQSVNELDAVVAVASSSSWVASVIAIAIARSSATHQRRIWPRLFCFGSHTPLPSAGWSDRIKTKAAICDREEFTNCCLSPERHSRTKIFWSSQSSQPIKNAYTERRNWRKIESISNLILCLLFFGDCSSSSTPVLEEIPIRWSRTTELLLVERKYAANYSPSSSLSL